METAAIHYRVADFLRKHPPFHAMEEGDVLELAGSGKVKFFEANEYIVVQGAPFMFQLYVIQQGSVTLWNEEGETALLQDVRGAGDFLGVEQFNGIGAYPYSARSSSDVVLYSFPAFEFETLVMKSGHARQYIAAYGVVSADYKAGAGQRDPTDIFIHELVTGKTLEGCDARTTIRDAASRLLTTGVEALAILDEKGRVQGALTANSLLDWIRHGGGDPSAAVESLVPSPLPSISSDASAAAATLALSASQIGALAMRENETADGKLLAVITPRDLTPVFGDHPVAILREIRLASTTAALQDLNQRVRAFILRLLNGAGSVDWLARFASQADAAILRQLLRLNNDEDSSRCWCFVGPAGRGETLTRLAPELVVITDDKEDSALRLAAYRRISEGLAECGYLPGAPSAFGPSFYAATRTEWSARYQGWIQDPIFQGIYQSRHLFDLRPIHGNRALWEHVDTTVRSAISGEFLYLVANDCLESLPPLTFFQDAVIDESGEKSDVFRLGYSALGPLVDVGRVFGMASGKIMGNSTLERFVDARMMLPDGATIFREASDALRVVLWLQARIGISQNTDGSELPPSLLGRYDRQILKSAFRSIVRLLELAGNPEWLKSV